MRKSANDLIPDAIEAITQKIAITENNELIVDSKYKGYIASFAVSIIQSGLLASIAFSTDLDKQGKTKEANRQHLMDALLYLLQKQDKNKEQERHLLKHILVREACDYDATTVNSNTLSKSRFYYWEQQIQQNTIALKLALKTFKLVKKDNDNSTAS